MGVPPVKIGPHPYLFFDDHPKAILYSGGQTNKPKGRSLWFVVGFVRWGYFWGDNNFLGWCYVIGLEFVCACARMVIFS